MEEEICKKIGDPEGLQFEFELADRKLRKGLAWGKGSLLIQGEPVWVTEDVAGNEQPVEWSWLDMLEFLAENWPWLVLEESYPLPINPLDVTGMESAAKRRWERLSEAIVDDEDEELIRFRYRHDLALALKGIYLPTVLLLRQGRLCQVGIPEWDTTILLSFAGVKDVLEELGAWIVGMVEGCDDARAQRAVALWRQRGARIQEWRLRLCTGMHAEELKKLLNGHAAEEFFEMTGDDPENGSELSFAARMAPGGLGIEGKKQVIEAVRELPPRKTPDLDELSRKALVTPFDVGSRSFEQGYVLAGWLRDQLGYAWDAVPDPEGILQTWGVLLRDVFLDLATEKLEAIAAWGPLHGPAVLVNMTSGARSVHEHRRRTSLAHEICHLLVDRDGGLPLVEVLGGRTPEIMEQRARAFAAEFLLPRSVAADAVRSGRDMKNVVSRLSETYNLSRELVAWQIINSEVHGILTEEEKGVLDAMRVAEE
ncbi:MAG: ImmA/IrrE family metallo-endopeptidase [Desulfoplanes sp.]|nr:ImmA/IrrE family metallo-endopeptidase [Desulfoplanes sp.]